MVEQQLLLLINGTDEEITYVTFSKVVSKFLRSINQSMESQYKRKANAGGNKNHAQVGLVSVGQTKSQKSNATPNGNANKTKPATVSVVKTITPS